MDYYNKGRDSMDSQGDVSTSRSKPRSFSLWRPLVNFATTRNTNTVLHSRPSQDDVSNVGRNSDGYIDKSKKITKNIVTVVIVEATNLPDLPNDGTSHTISCKIRLGSETVKSKSVPSSRHPKWMERLELHLNKDHLLKVTISDKGKMRNFLGNCVIDLSTLEKERTHEIWQELDDGFGTIHLNVTMCAVRNNVITSDSVQNLDDATEKFAFYNIKSNWRIVGQLNVKVVGAKGLSGRPDAYCTLELDNERVQTPSARASSEPEWNKSYIFNVFDVTSTLDLEVNDSSLVNTLLTESLGRVSIPLLRIRNGALYWYALKDRNRRNSAKGNCPRVFLALSLIWNPVTAALRLFRPKEVKYIKKPKKFDIGQVYSNLEFIRDALKFANELNHSIMRFLEWDNREVSSVVLVIWLVFWYNFRAWLMPLLLLMPFQFYLCLRSVTNKSENSSTIVNFNDADESSQSSRQDNNKNEQTGKIHRAILPLSGLQDMTLTITNGIEYIASVAERLYKRGLFEQFITCQGPWESLRTKFKEINIMTVPCQYIYENLILVTFKVPFLSYLTMLLLIGTSIVLYFVPVNYLLMALGTYKYCRKILNPRRKLNNDLLDFISRIPDNEDLRNWKELKVPEPNHRRTSSDTLIRSNSNNP